MSETLNKIDDVCGDDFQIEIIKRQSGEYSIFLRISSRSTGVDNIKSLEEA